MRSVHSFSVVAILMSFAAAALVAPAARADDCSYSSCEQGYNTCEQNAARRRAQDETNCWYAYGWTCQYAEPGQDYGACQDYSTCMWYAGLFHGAADQECQNNFSQCVESCLGCGPNTVPCG